MFSTPNRARLKSLKQGQQGLTLHQVELHITIQQAILFILIQQIIAARYMPTIRSTSTDKASRPEARLAFTGAEPLKIDAEHRAQTQQDLESRRFQPGFPRRHGRLGNMHLLRQLSLIPSTAQTAFPDS